VWAPHVDARAMPRRRHLGLRRLGLSFPRKFSRAQEDSRPERERCLGTRASRPPRKRGSPTNAGRMPVFPARAWPGERPWRTQGGMAVRPEAPADGLRVPAPAILRSPLLASKILIPRSSFLIPHSSVPPPAASISSVVSNPPQFKNPKSTIINRQSRLSPRSSGGWAPGRAGRPRSQGKITLAPQHPSPVSCLIERRGGTQTRGRSVAPATFKRPANRHGAFDLNPETGEMIDRDGEPLSEVDAKKRGFVRCRKCGRTTRAVLIDVRYTNWLLIFLIGLWAILFPSPKQSEYFCEHCGKTFLPEKPPFDRGGRIVGAILAAFTILVMGAIAYLLIDAYRSD